MNIEELTSKVHRVKFRRWVELEDLREQVIRAVEDKAEGFPSRFHAYLSTALGIKTEEIRGLAWVDCLNLFYAVHNANLPPSHLPLVSATPKDKKSQRDDWDYPGRLWFYYANLLAGAYGWTLDYIAELSIEDGLSLVQELMTSDQLKKEFEWGMSEIAYPYNSKTKKSRYSPLPRPYWMLPVAKEVKDVRIPKRLMPQGFIIDAGTGRPTSTS